MEVNGYTLRVNEDRNVIFHFSVYIQLFLSMVIGCKIDFYMLFELKCVLAVYVHNHPIMIKIHPVFFCLFFLINFFDYLDKS